MLRPLKGWHFWLRLIELRPRTSSKRSGRQSQRGGFSNQGCREDLVQDNDFR
uniref:Uncharacterized protein n=1 Tax=Fagus sylvatica TaxID=28930 RepID=A0A2N9GV87_FAGSY